MPSGNLSVPDCTAAEKGEWRSFFLPDELYVRLKAFAEARQDTESTVVREGLEKIIGDTPKESSGFHELYFQDAEAHPS